MVEPNSSSITTNEGPPASTAPEQEQSRKPKKRHLVNREILAPLEFSSIDTSRNVSFPVHSKIVGKVKCNDNKEIIVDWQYVISPDGTKIQLSEGDHSHLKHRFKKSEEIKSSFITFLENHISHFNPPRPAKRRRQTVVRSNENRTPELNTADSTSLSQRFAQHAYETQIRRGILQEVSPSQLTDIEMQQNGNPLSVTNHPEESDDFSRDEAEQDDDLNFINQHSKSDLVFDDSNCQYNFRNQDSTEQFPDHLGQDACATGDGGISPSEEEDLETIEEHLKYIYNYGPIPENTQDDDENFYEAAPEWAEEEDKIRDDFPEHLFDDPFELFMYVSGLNQPFFEQMTRNMNQYVRKEMRKTHAGVKYAGSRWKQFETKEIIHFLGILLKASQSGDTGGGYAQYFEEVAVKISLGEGEHLNASKHGSKPWARQYMTKQRFEQILRAFRAEGEAPKGVKDKAFQLRCICLRLS